MKVTLNDEQVFEGEDSRAVVRQMRDVDWNGPPRKGEYMHDVARRLGGGIRTDDPDVFLFDLERQGLCRIEYLTDEQATRFASLAVNFRATTFGEPNLGRSEVEEEGPGDTAPTWQMPQDDEEPE